MVLATKFHIHPEQLNTGKGLYGIIRNHLEASMKRLGTDYIDLYYLHRTNDLVPVDTLKTAHDITPVSAVQNLYSMVERDCEKEIFPYCIQNHIGVVPFSPIASGLLSGKVTVDTKFEGDDVRKFVPQLSKENLAANRPLLDAPQIP